VVSRLRRRLPRRIVAGIEGADADLLGERAAAAAERVAQPREHAAGALLRVRASIFLAQQLCPASRHWWSLEPVENREAGVRVQARSCEERDADAPGEEGVPAWRLRLMCERVDGEPAPPLEPALVPGALEGLQERVPVPGGAVAEARALLRAGRASPPRQLGAGGQQPP